MENETNELLKQLVAVMGDMKMVMEEMRTEIKSVRKTDPGTPQPQACPRTDDLKKYELPMDRKTAAQYLGVHPRTLYRWSATEGKIKYSLLGKGGTMSYEREDLDAYIASCAIPTVGELKSRRDRKRLG